MVDTIPPALSSHVYVKDINGLNTNLKVGSWYKISNVENSTSLKPSNETSNDYSIPLISSKCSNLISDSELFTFIPIEEEGYIMKNRSTGRIVSCIQTKDSCKADLRFDDGTFINQQVVNLALLEGFKDAFVIKLKDNGYELNVYDAYFNKESYSVTFREPNTKWITYAAFNMIEPMLYSSPYRYAGKNRSFELVKTEKLN